jgi:hypothetical protein
MKILVDMREGTRRKCQVVTFVRKGKNASLTWNQVAWCSVWNYLGNKLTS